MMVLKLWRCININNDNSIIKARIDSTLIEALKEILNKKNMTQQDLIDTLIKNFVLDNLNLIIPNTKGSK